MKLGSETLARLSQLGRGFDYFEGMGCEFLRI
jgi:hypothetical protein